jgi:hypothetical protein
VIGDLKEADESARLEASLRKNGGNMIEIVD